LCKNLNKKVKKISVLKNNTFKKKTDFNQSFPLPPSSSRYDPEIRMTSSPIGWVERVKQTNKAKRVLEQLYDMN
jgi:hypothetical protein